MVLSLIMPGDVVSPLGDVSSLLKSTKHEYRVEWASVVSTHWLPSFHWENDLPDSSDMEGSVNYKVFPDIWPHKWACDPNLTKSSFPNCGWSKSQRGSDRTKYPSRVKVYGPWGTVSLLPGWWPGRTLKPRAPLHPFTLSQLSSSHSLVWLAKAAAPEMGPKCHKCNLVLVATVTSLMSDGTGLLFDGWGKSLSCPGQYGILMWSLKLLQPFEYLREVSIGM